MARKFLIHNESNTWKKAHQIGTMKIDLIDAHPAFYIRIIIRKKENMGEHDWLKKNGK